LISINFKKIERAYGVNAALFIYRTLIMRNLVFYALILFIAACAASATFMITGG
tara:strand:- start:687 stop:848 length:162 start_codon:yes stop_codon:yes gene_type:complete